MESIFNGQPLVPGERIQGTALTFILAVLPRRAEFLCDCGRTKVYGLNDVEKGKRKSCGCRCHKLKGEK